ncbi:MAG: cupin domain-containing protein [Sulfobacillus sp.]
MESAGVRMNEAAMAWEPYGSPRGVYGGFDRDISLQLTAAPKVPGSDAVMRPRPFEIRLVRLPPGKRNCPRHAHSMQWEYYIVLTGRGRMLQEDGADPIPMEPGDHLSQPAGWVHTVENSGGEDLTYYVIADNPVDETWRYPDSAKWGKGGHIFRMIETDYWDGEE